MIRLKHITATLIIVLIAMQSIAQKKASKAEEPAKDTLTALDTIRIDFFNLNARRKYKYVRYGHKYVMEITNLNQSLYKVEGTVVGTDFNTDMPAIFSKIELPGYLNFALPEMDAAKSLKVTNSVDDSIKNFIVTIETSYLGIRKTIVLNNEFINLYTSCDLTYAEIEKQLMGHVNTYLGEKTNKMTRKEQEAQLKVILSKFIFDAKDAGRYLDKLVPPRLAVLKLDLEKNRNLIDSLKAIKVQTESIKKLIVEKTSQNTAITTYSDSLKLLVTKVQGFVAELDKFNDDNKINALINNYKMINPSHFTYYTNAVKAKKDEMAFDIRISSDKLLPCNNQTKVSLSETYAAKGGFKVDFSTGIFFSSGNDDFMGRELEYKKQTDSTKTIVAKDGGKRAVIGVGALMHGYWRTGGCMNVGFGAGLSTTAAFDALNFHLGLSLLCGREDRFVITGGITMREAEILDKQYDYNTVYANDALPDAPPTIKVFPQYGGFISLTYNWSKLKK